MYLLDSYVDIFTLSLLSSLKSCSHISEENWNKVVTYHVLKLLLWGDFSLRKPLLICLVFVQQSTIEQRHIFGFA